MYDRGVLLQDTCAAAEEFVVEGFVVLLAEDAGGELGVEGAQRGVDAETGIGFLQGRVPIGGDQRRRGEDGSSQVAEDL